MSSRRRGLPELSPSPLATLAELPAKTAGQHSERAAATRPKLAAAELAGAPLCVRYQIRGIRIGVVGEAQILGGAGLRGGGRGAMLEQVSAGKIRGRQGRGERLAVPPLAQRPAAGRAVIATR